MATVTGKGKIKISHDLETHQVEALNRLAKEQYTSRSALVRKAVALFLAQNSTDSANQNGADRA